jgi:hypothetical protein
MGNSSILSTVAGEWLILFPLYLNTFHILSLDGSVVCTRNMSWLQGIHNDVRRMAAEVFELCSGQVVRAPKHFDFRIVCSIACGV